MWPSAAATSLSWTRMRSLLFSKLPSTMLPTPSRRPASIGSISLPLKIKTDAREMTFSSGTFESSLIMLSVMPSLKYSAVGSPVRFLSGSTATELMFAGALLLDLTRRYAIAATAIIRQRASATINLRCIRRGRRCSGRSEIFACNSGDAVVVPFASALSAIGCKRLRSSGINGAGSLITSQMSATNR